jgi:hypothetical protein
MLFLSLPLDSMTGRTVTDSATLQHQLKLAAKRGYAVESSENEDGSMCIGAAILDDTSYPIAAISLSAPESRMTPRSSHAPPSSSPAQPPPCRRACAARRHGRNSGLGAGESKDTGQEHGPRRGPRDPRRGMSLTPPGERCRRWRGPW